MESLALKLECSKSQVCKWEFEKIVPSEERIWKMVQILGTGDFVVKNEKAISDRSAEKL